MVDCVYFKPAEFLKAQPTCSIADMDDDLLRQLDHAREIAGVPFHINSAFRSSEYELKHGRSGKSAHCLGKAVDIRCLNSFHRFKIVQSAIMAGFSRIGIYKRFVHLDISGFPAHTPCVIWLESDSKSEP